MNRSNSVHYLTLFFSKSIVLSFLLLASCFDNLFGHCHVPWDRPRFEISSLEGFHCTKCLTESCDYCTKILPWGSCGRWLTLISDPVLWGTEQTWNKKKHGSLGEGRHEKSLKGSIARLSHICIQKTTASWWFQLSWKIWVKLDHLPK